MAQKTLVSAAVVREWARENISLIPEANRAGLGPNARGQLHPNIIAAYEKANQRKTYTRASEAEKPTVTVPVTSVDKAGRKTTRPVTVTTERAREVLGAEGKVGRLSHATLSEALSALAADEVADTFTKAA